jgi:hypothetical protein
MEPTSLIRLLSQMALVTWAATEGVLLLLSRGRHTPVVGVRFSLTALVCFGAWMFLSALTIRDTALFPRDQLLWWFALLEAGTATAAWASTVVKVRKTFNFNLRVGQPKGPTVTT